MGMVRYLSWGLAFAFMAIAAYFSEQLGVPRWLGPVVFFAILMALHVGYRWGSGYWMGDEPSGAESPHRQPRP